MHLKRYIPLVLGAILTLSGCAPEKPVELPKEVNAPSEVTLVSSDESSLVFSWKEVADAEYYVARLETSSGALVPGGQTTTKETSIGFDGLQAGVAYVFKVRVRVAGIDSPFSDSLQAVTAKQENPGPGPGPTPNPNPTPSESYKEFMIPAVEDEHKLPISFPGAEGGGMYTTGGRGGKVIHVTTLADSGAGSLRAALAESGPRTIVFDVAGIIELKSALSIKNGNVTIAGQTAPGDGICIKNYDVKFEGADNIIIRFIRFRMGDEAKREADALWGRYNRNIIIDHCSMSWSTDECSSFYANEYFTMQWCLIAESLRNSIHGKGSHGYGGIWGGKNASFHHNLLSCHDSRNPRIDHPQIYGNYVETHRGNVDYRCNAVYNWGSNLTYGGEGGWFNIVNNYYKPGPASSDRKYFVDAYGSYVKNGVTYADSYPELYLSGNVNTKYPELGAANDKTTIYWHNGSSYANYNVTLSSPLDLAGPQGAEVYTTTHTAEDAFARICAYAGASLSRDSVDDRVCADAQSGKATYADGGNGSKNGIIDTQSAVGGWPVYDAAAEELAKVKDTDADGMEGISIPQPFCAGFVPFAEVINKGLDKIPGMDKLEIDAEGMKKKFGLLGEPLFLGILVGIIIGALSCESWKEVVDKIPYILGAGIKMGAVMELIPRITSLFIEGLKPISEATRELINRKFKGTKGLNIGMSPALVIGHPTTLVVSLLLIPVTLLLAVILPGNEFLPLASLAGMFYIFPLVLPITKGNVVKTFIVGLVVILIGLYFVTDLAPFFTQAAQDVFAKTGDAAVAIPAGFEGGSLDFASSPLAWVIFHLSYSLKWIGAGILVIVTMVLAVLNRRAIIKK